MGCVAQSEGERLELIVIGGGTGRERKVIRDRDGEVEVHVAFDTDADWYRSVGTCRVNGDVYHFYEF